MSSKFVDPASHSIKACENSAYDLRAGFGYKEQVRLDCEFPLNQWHRIVPWRIVRKYQIPEIRHALGIIGIVDTDLGRYRSDA